MCIQLAELEREHSTRACGNGRRQLRSPLLGLQGSLCVGEELPGAEIEGFIRLHLADGDRYCESAVPREELDRRRLVSLVAGDEVAQVDGHRERVGSD